jgi:hypothetical protein
VERIQSRIARGFRNSVCLFHDALPFAAVCLRHLIDRLAEFSDVRIAAYDPWHPEGMRLVEEDPCPPCPATCPPDVCRFQFGDSLILSRSGRNTLYVLNETGSLIWEHLARGASETETARSLANTYRFLDRRS